ncbi:MAG: hypothetical protein FJX78_08780 [Armatimonadetes bacterium]|nr:hypothetical protein [Armatimonadota bacterium]
MIVVTELIDAADIAALERGDVPFEIDPALWSWPAALAGALRGGRLAGAMLDVIPTEPLTADDPLRSALRLMITPHVADLTEEAQARISADIAAGVLSIVAGSGHARRG